METVRLLAMVNLIVQVVLMGVVVYAGFVASARNLRKHCAIMRVAVAVQLIAILAVMAPSLLGYTVNRALAPLFYAEMLAHAIIGLTIVGIWVFVNLVQTGVIKFRRRLLGIMRTAFFLWAAAFAIGVHMYLVIWVI
ncbi:MAG: hypothetical protein HYX84_05140 [Chloroflexi bacterium]|nr:hypothetical protein [Chloroflexota bacterium]